MHHSFNVSAFSRRKSSLNQFGFSLISVLVASAMIIIFALSLYRSIVVQYQFTSSSFERVQALYFAQELLEYQIGRGYIGLCNNNNVSGLASPGGPINQANGAWVTLVNSAADAINTVGRFPSQDITPDLTDPRDSYRYVRLFSPPNTPWQRVMFARVINLEVDSAANFQNQMPNFFQTLNPPSAVSNHAYRGILLVSSALYSTPQDAEAVGNNPSRMKNVGIMSLVPASRYRKALLNIEESTNYFGANCPDGLL